jgi:3-hydroxyisobutyrate dehydrogenase-like beta-hydroxyacid dehydrogenase
MQNESQPIGLVNPGAMGSAIGRALGDAGKSRDVLWASDGRSAETKARAAAAGLVDVGSLATLTSSVGTIVSVCPPGSALELAKIVAGAGFAGRYIDANAVSPATARAIADCFDDVVDGGIVGPPPMQPGTTRLYLSGQSAEQSAALFAGSKLEVRVVDGGAGAASAVKMCFAGWTKGTSALLFALRALAEAEGVTDALLGEWDTSMPELIARSERSPAMIGPKAWRFEPEMQEIADSFAAVGLPDGFHRSAAEIYGRMHGFKGRPNAGDDATTLAEVMAALISTD